MFPLSDSAHSGILPAYSNPKPCKDQAEVAGGSTCYDRSLSASLLLSVPFPFHSLFFLSSFPASFHSPPLGLSITLPCIHSILFPPWSWGLGPVQQQPGCGGLSEPWSQVRRWDSGGWSDWWPPSRGTLAPPGSHTLQKENRGLKTQVGHFQQRTHSLSLFHL